MLVMVIQVNPTIDKVLYYLVLKDQASKSRFFVLYILRMNVVSDDYQAQGMSEEVSSLILVGL